MDKRSEIYFFRKKWEKILKYPQVRQAFHDAFVDMILTGVPQEANIIGVLPMIKFK